MSEKVGKGAYLETLLRSPRTVFSVTDAALLWGEQDAGKVARRLSVYARHGKLVALRRGLYGLDREYDRLELATRISTPAYISFETVLTRTGVSFQRHDPIFVASYVTRDIVVDGQTISLQRIKDEVLCDPSGIERRDGYSIATKERAFLDRFYVSKEYHFDNPEALDVGKVLELLPIYGNLRFARRVKNYLHDLGLSETQTHPAPHPQGDLR